MVGGIAMNIILLGVIKKNIVCCATAESGQSRQVGGDRAGHGGDGKKSVAEARGTCPSHKSGQTSARSESDRRA